MNVTETFSSECSQVPSSKPLFPVSVVNEPTSRPKSLFPVLDGSSNVDNNAPTEGELDWLENKSYGDKAASSVLELQKAIAEHEASVSHTNSGIQVSESEDEVSSSDDKLLATDKRAASPQDDDHQSKKKKKTSKHKHKHKKHKSKKSVPSDNPENRSLLSEKFTTNTKKVFLEEMTDLEPEHAFRIDRKRDKDLWTYESLYKAHIASYRRLGLSALGVLGNLDLFRHETSMTNKPNLTRYFQRKNRTQIKQIGKIVKAKEKDMRVEYIPLEYDAGGTDGAGAASSVTDPHHLMDEATQMYIQGKGFTQGDQTDLDTNFDDEILRKVANFNKRLRENPRDIQLWLDFVKFQDQVFTSNGVGDLSGKPRTSQALIDKKLAILTRALTENPSSLELQLAQLEVCEGVWDTDRVAKEWDQLLFVHSADVHLWRRYLLYQQSRLASFSVSKMTKLYHKCFRVLTAVMEGHVNTIRSTENLPFAVVDIFHQYCTFLKQVGQTERAIASYQAQIEFNMFHPPALRDTATSDCVTVFESFWDSSVPRFGEKGAKGWAVWTKEKSVTETEVTQTENTEDAEELIITQGLPTWKTWLEIEMLREQAHWLPWRPDLSKNETEEDCEDLERLVLVDDIMPVLFRLPSKSFCFSLVLGFLQVLGLDTEDMMSSLCMEHISRGGGCFLQMFLDSLYQIHPAALLETGFEQLEKHWKIFPTLQTFVTEILSQSIKSFSGQHQTVFTLLQIKFECVRHGVDSLRDLPKDKSKELRKCIKNLLKLSQNRSNLTVWNAYTWLEYELGRTSDAVGILETALTMFSGGNSEDKPGLGLLYQTYCQLHLNFSHHLNIDLSHKQQATSADVRTKILFSLSTLAENSKFKVEKTPNLSTSTVLRTRRKLQTSVDNLLEQVLAGSDKSEGEGHLNMCQHLLSVLNCLTVFELLTSDLDTALSHYTRVLAALDANRPAQHSQTVLKYNVYKSEILLIQNHMSSSVVPLSKLRSSLDKALHDFPDSSEFLKCLIDVESKSHIVGRLRRYVDKVLVTPTSPVSLILGVLAEVTRMRTLQEEEISQDSHDRKDRWSKTGMVHRVRRLLERGTHSSVSQHCPLVWRLYYHIENQYGDNSRVKGIFYSALQQCPWSKVLYIDGVRLLGEDKLQEMVDLMTEKELRVQIPVEELELLSQSEPAPRTAEMENQSVSDEES